MAKVQGWVCSECGAENVWGDASASPFEPPPACSTCGKVPFAQIYCEVEDGTPEARQAD
jgi:hypothetical protein